jgi:hypothetical protein
MLRTCWVGRAQIYQLTARLRRQFPRVFDVLNGCDELERLSRVDTTAPLATETPSKPHVVSTACAECARRRRSKAEAAKIAHPVRPNRFRRPPGYTGY